MQATLQRCVAFKAAACPRAAHRVQATRIPSQAPSNTLKAKTPAAYTPSAATCFMAAGIALAAASTLLPEPAAAAQHAVDVMGQAPQAAVEQFQLAEGGQEFWSNLARYGRYFVTVMLGTGYVMLRPLASAFKNPLTAVLTIAVVAGGIYFVKFTLQAMLAVDDIPFDYIQGEF